MLDRSIREILVRNILCFFFPMLLGCRIEAYFNKTLLAGPPPFVSLPHIIPAVVLSLPPTPSAPRPPHLPLNDKHQLTQQHPSSQIPVNATPLSRAVRAQKTTNTHKKEGKSTPFEDAKSNQLCLSDSLARITHQTPSSTPEGV